MNNFWSPSDNVFHLHRFRSFYRLHSVANTQNCGKCVKQHCSKSLTEAQTKSWDDKLDSLLVQSKFKDVVARLGVLM